MLVSLNQKWLIGKALCANRNNATYVDSFGVEHVPKSIKKFAKNKNIITNI